MGLIRVFPKNSGLPTIGIRRSIVPGIVEQTLLDAPFTGSDQGYADAQVLDTSGEGVVAGQLLVEETRGTVALASNRLTITTGGVADWVTLWVMGKTTAGGAFGRGDYFEFVVNVTTANFGMIGFTTTAPHSNLNQVRHAFFMQPTGRLQLRNVGDVAANANIDYSERYVTGVDYTIRIYLLTQGGALYLIKGGHYGSNFRALGYTKDQTETSLYPIAIASDLTMVMDNWKIVRGAPPPKVYFTYYDGGRVAGQDTAIGQAFSIVTNDIFMGRYIANPIVSEGAAATWDDEQTKDPYVLKDGDTWKMWYAGYSGTAFGIGYATSTDGRSWTKSGSNPVLTVGAGGAWDDAGVSFPVVYKDNDEGDANKRWKMFYCGNDGGAGSAAREKIGYAYSADGIAWTKYASNPVVNTGAGSSWDEGSVIPNALVKDGSTFYLFYDGRSTVVTWPSEHQVGLVTFTAFDGTYTKAAGNPILARRTGDQALTSNLAILGTSVAVADSSGFTVGEVVLLASTAGKMQNKISAIPNGTTITLAIPVYTGFTTANGSRIVTFLRSLSPRAVIKDGSTWRMWLTAFQAGAAGGTNNAETEYYATSANPDSGWAFDHTNSPPFWLALMGEPVDSLAWDSSYAENLVFALDADTNERFAVDL